VEALNPAKKYYLIPATAIGFELRSPMARRYAGGSAIPPLKSPSAIHHVSTPEAQDIWGGNDGNTRRWGCGDAANDEQRTSRTPIY
jgi:hypothetical protein